MRYLRTIFCVLLVLIFATSALADDDDNKRVSKKKKYSDNGAKCKSVRNGNAALCGRAMIGSDGVTLLELNTNDQFGRPTGTIIKVEVKPKHEGMRKQTFDNINLATFSLNLEGLEKGDNIKVEAKVRGKDGKKKEISLTVPVLDRPNLAVVSVDAPETARANVPVIVSAVIANSGDFGATADCVLYADGAQVDVAPQIWVDAHDSDVGCMLTHTFTTGGLKTLQVSLNNVLPGDFNLADNSASRQINIVASLNFLSYTAFAQERETTIEYLDGSRPNERDVRITTSMNGTVGALDFASASVTADEATGATTISSTFTLQLLDGCLSGPADQHARFVSICQAPTGEIDFSLSRMARVTYLSSGVDAQGNQTYIITGSQGAAHRFGSTYEFRVTLSDLSSVYEANAIISLVETNSTFAGSLTRTLVRLLRGTATGPVQ